LVIARAPLVHDAVTLTVAWIRATGKLTTEDEDQNTINTKAL
jgi:hypothetical protein